MRRLRFAALALGVLAVHLVALQGVDHKVWVAEKPAVKAMVTRAIETPAAAPPVKTAELATQRHELATGAVRVPFVRLTPALSPEGRGRKTVPSAKQLEAPKLAIAVPPSVRLAYVVTGSSRGRTFEGKALLTWQHDATGYEARLEVSTPLLPARTQESRGEITAQGLAPARFSDRYRGEQATHFERGTGKVVFSSNTAQADLMPGAQDRLSVVLQLAALIAGEPAKFREGSAITVQTAGTREALPWVFTVEGFETLQLPGGETPALKLTRAPQREYDQRVEVWLAPGQAYVPVRLRLTNSNADWIDQQWSDTDRP